jgi:hypothetical protein
MKALSIRQPWAWFILHGGKDIENRTWNTNFRGEFLIHASSGMSKREWHNACTYALMSGWKGALPGANDLERGGVVGIARLVDVLPPTKGDIAAPRMWKEAACYGFVLTDVRTLPFVPLKGALGFFDVEWPR